MIKKDITYKSLFTDGEVTKTCWFHISPAKITEWEIEEHKEAYSKDGETLTGPRAILQRVIDSEDGKGVITGIKEFIRRSYGVRDGDDFLQSDELSDKFMASEACSQLILELCTDADAAAEFMNGVAPKNLDEVAEKMREQQLAKEAAKTSSAVESGATPEPLIGDGLTREGVIANATPENPVDLTHAEAREMTHEQLSAGIATGRYKLS